MEAAAEEISKSNYAEIGRILREISEAYVDEDVAIRGRGLGSKEGSSVEEINRTNYPLTWNNTYTKGNNGFPYTDTYDTDDITVLNEQNMFQSSGFVWYAARGLEVDSGHSAFGVRFSGTSIDEVYDYYLFYEYSSGTAFSPSYSMGVRPVIILKPGIKITGAGTEGEPWKIN